LRLPETADSRLMLAGPAPALIAPIQQLSRVMLASQLLKHPPEVNGLLDGRFVGDARSQ
jgi:hypothetical protein